MAFLIAAGKLESLRVAARIPGKGGEDARLFLQAIGDKGEPAAPVEPPAPTTAPAVARRPRKAKVAAPTTPAVRVADRVHVPVWVKLGALVAIAGVIHAIIAAVG
jgi:hypothetical protein